MSAAALLIDLPSPSGLGGMGETGNVTLGGVMVEDAGIAALDDAADGDDDLDPVDIRRD